MYRNALVWRNLMNGAFSQAANPCPSAPSSSTSITSTSIISASAADGSTSTSADDAGPTTGDESYEFPSNEETMTGKQRRKRKRRIDLSPINPQEPSTILRWMESNDMRCLSFFVICQSVSQVIICLFLFITKINKLKKNNSVLAYSGIRMVYDHMGFNVRDVVPYEQLLQAELRLFFYPCAFTDCFMCMQHPLHIHMFI
jgi:hypothetical protein